MGNGAVIARCSQPEVGWLGWRSGEDEDLIKAISDACTFDRGTHTMMDKESSLSHSPASVHSEDSNQTQPEISIQERKVLHIYYHYIILFFLIFVHYVFKLIIFFNSFILWI